VAAVRPGRSRRILRRPAPRHRVPAWWNPYVQPQRRRAFKPPRDGSGGATLLRDERRVVAARRLLLLVDRRLGIARIYLSGRLVIHPSIYPSTSLPIHLPPYLSICPPQAAQQVGTRHLPITAAAARRCLQAGPRRNAAPGGLRARAAARICRRARHVAAAAHSRRARRRLALVQGRRPGEGETVKCIVCVHCVCSVRAWCMHRV